MYALDTNAARHADTAGATIKELGKYVGEISAKDLTAIENGVRQVYGL